MKRICAVEGSQHPSRTISPNEGHPLETENEPLSSLWLKSALAQLGACGERLREILRVTYGTGGGEAGPFGAFDSVQFLPFHHLKLDGDSGSAYQPATGKLLTAGGAVLEACIGHAPEASLVALTLGRILVR